MTLKHKTIITFFSILFLLAGVESIFVSASTLGDNIIITEVEFDPAGNENEAEWFELYNPTETPIDIGGWTIEEGSVYFFTFPNTTIIPAFGYLLVVNETADFNATYPTITPDIDMGGAGCYTDAECLRLNNTGND